MNVNGKQLDGIMAFFKSTEAHAAFTATITGGVIIFSTPGSIKDKMPYIIDYLWGVFGVWGAVIASQGYQKGKALEGTVPDGRQPTNAPVNVNVGAAGDHATGTVSAQPQPAADPLADLPAGFPGRDKLTTTPAPKAGAVDEKTAAMLAALAAGHSTRRKG